MCWGSPQRKTRVQPNYPIQRSATFQSHLPQKNRFNQKVPLRILVASWNMASRLQPIQEIAKLLSPQRLSQHDIVVVGTQECEDLQWIAFFKNSKHDWQKLLNSYMLKEFQLVCKEGFHGTHIIAYARPQIMPYINATSLHHTYAGFKGLTGSKAAVSLNFAVGSKTFNFINCHLKADHHNSDKRNEGLNRILRRLSQRHVSDEVYLFGDLNYRIQMTKYESLFFNVNTNMQQYELRDQLHLQKKLDEFLQLYKQGPLNFGPTYKLRKDRHEYANQRIPGWTDRIFYQSKMNQVQLQYYGADFNVLGSDHRPVIASFLTSFDIPSGNPSMFRTY